MPTNINGNTGIDKVQDGTVVSADIATLDASKLTGTVAPARLGSGSAGSGNFLRGDGSWQTAGSTSASDLTSGTLADARFPSTLPAASAANLTAIPAANITGTLPAISGANLTSLPVQKINPNILINGGFEFAQRGTTISGIGSAKYTLDRWTAISSGADSTVNKVNGATYPKALRLTGAGSTSGTYLQQKVESVNSRHLAGQTATFSVYLRASTAKTVEFSIKYATSTDNFSGTTSIATANFSVTTTDTKFTWTGSIPSAAITGIQVQLKISSQGSAWYEASNAKLEIGSIATDFEPRSYGEELALCKRYYQRFGHATLEQPIGAGTFNTSIQVLGFFPYYNEMRTIPTISVSSNGFLRAYAGYSGNKISVSQDRSYLDGITTTSARINTDFGSSTGGQGAFLQIVAGQYIYLDAEL